MIFIFDIFIAENLTIKNGLKNIFGINNYYANFFLKKLGFSSNAKIKNLNAEQIKSLITIIENSKLLLNNDLKLLLVKNHSKYINLKCYKGLRKVYGYPVRGQRTRSNAKTAKKVLKNLKLL
uniref:Ribosomal protein S13 n=1 Tax=Melosira undulata TaxID=2133757 RepID=A0A3G1PWF9_9STRA|nr:ribosomal protein S13 [Melosira undulata]AVR57573.1 ribosomal protein S13 [Melosira undulata]